MQILSFPSGIQQLNSIWNSKHVRAAGLHFTPQALMATFNSSELVMADSPKKRMDREKSLTEHCHETPYLSKNS